jgi:antibiotic biosynthesis monooxygenase (ABM) superfamily enzyme
MITRIWHGWTAPDNADTYETLLRTDILPGIAGKQIPGYRGAHLLRRELADEVEFITMLWFESKRASCMKKSRRPARRNGVTHVQKHQDVVQLRSAGHR